MITLNTRHGIAEAIRLTIAGKAYDLSEALQSQVLRLMFIKDYQALGRSRRATIGELKEQFNVDTAQAYQDYAVAKKYLLQENLIEQRDIQVSILFDNILEQIDLELRKNKPDAKALAMLNAVHARAIKEFTGDKELIDWSKVVLPVPVMKFDPALVGSAISSKMEEFTLVQEKYRKLILNGSKVQQLPAQSYDDVPTQSD